MRRKEVGREIKRARRKVGYTSQEAFAAAIRKHESSVANAERGSDRIGESVYNAIEDGLGWPANSILDYIEGRTDEFPPPAGNARPVDDKPWVPVLTDEQIIAMTSREIMTHYVQLDNEFGKAPADDWLFHAASIRYHARRAAQGTVAEGSANT